MKDEIKERIRNYAYGKCTQAELEQLQEILKSSPAARDVFLSEMNLLSALEDISLNTNLSDLTTPRGDLGENGRRDWLLSNWAMPLAIAVAVLLLVTSIFWQRNQRKSLASDRAKIENREKKQERMRGENAEIDDRHVDFESEHDRIYPNWVIEKKLMTREELRGFEAILLDKEFDREQFPLAMEVVVRFALQKKNKNSDKADVTKLKKLIAGSGWSEGQVESVLALAERLSQTKGFGLPQEND